MTRATRVGLSRDRTRARQCTAARLAALAVAAVLTVGCSDEDGARTVAVPGRPGDVKSAAAVRAARRAFDGSPPVIPHAPMGATCTSCHDARGLEVAGLGFAPPSPHEHTPGLSATSRCNQCHVFAQTKEVFVASSFTGLAQDLRHGDRLHPLAPPVLPHPVFMRENCVACHSGPAAREEIRTSHPERGRCLQCHLPAVTSELFVRP